MTNDTIIADLLKKIDSLQEVISYQNNFIMKMATYRDEREDRLSSKEDERFNELLKVASESGLVVALSKFLLDLIPGQSGDHFDYDYGCHTEKTEESDEAEDPEGAEDPPDGGLDS